MANDGFGEIADATLREFAGGQKLFGRYALIKILGRGGMGVVWLARDEELEREVALKFLPDVVVHDRGMLNDLKSETKRSLELTHKNIVRIYDFVNDERSACISMEYINGDTLSNLRAEKKNKVFEPGEIAGWTAQLCDALDYAHNYARIIHRDLKPGNLMITQRGDLKVQDFGIARSLGDTASRLTVENMRSGTLVYMSPQQLDGERGTHLDDIYSLGATLYDLLTGKPPFYSGNIDRQVHERVAPSMTERRKDLNIEPALVPSIWEETIAACLAKDPTQRPQSIAEVAHRLQLASAPPTILYPAFFRQKKRAILGVAAILGALLIGSLYFFKFKETGKPVAANPATVPSAVSISEKSIAVLPFDTFSDEKENAYFADGVQDDILTDLANVADLKVISRRSVAQYRGSTKDVREIGQALQVAHVLEGTVRKIGGKLRITAQLIDTRTEAQTWGEKYERDLADIFAIQSEISKTIVAKLKATLSPAEKAAIEKEPTQDLEAYDLYLRARSLLNTFGMLGEVREKNLAESEKLLEQALSRDPNFLLAHCLMSDVQRSFYWKENKSAARLARAQAEVDSAMRIAPESGEAHLALAVLYYAALDRDMPYRPGRQDRALEELKIVAGKLPGNVDATALLAAIEDDRGQWKDALRDYEKAVQLDPRDPDQADALIQFYFKFRRYADAERLITRTMTSIPEQSTGALWRTKAAIARARGDTKASMAALKASPNRKFGTTSYRREEAELLMFERKYPESLQVLEGLDEIAGRPLNPNAVIAPFKNNPWLEGRCFKTLGTLFRLQGHQDKARTAFDRARKDFSEWLTVKDPHEPYALAWIAVLDAGAGRKEQALREGAHAAEVWPLPANPRNGAIVAREVAVIYAWAGEREKAIRQLQAIVQTPESVDAGDLKLNPEWDDLRADPRFEKIVIDAAQPIKID
ncbi:MAG: serine/threonine protein kinase with repeat [Spartobacteria bacterium]|nr:serine/threonine protein kinase with repeat [Spartobacteria bacterium]